MAKHLVRIRICKMLSKRKNDLSRIYLATAGIRVFGQNTRSLIVAGILACAAAAVRCASKPRRRASSDVFSVSSCYLLAAGLSDLLADRSSVTGNSSIASSFSFSSSSSSSDSTSRERGVGIDGVITTGGEAVVLFLFFFFCYTPFTAGIAAATAEADFFPIVDLVLRRDFAMPPASGSVPASASVSSSASTDESDS
jgi:hypothetical protein